MDVTDRQEEFEKETCDTKAIQCEFKETITDGTVTT
jgi:hypothetical protein